MNFYKTDILFQEVPGEISLSFYITGCPLKCKGCHSPELWTEKNTPPLHLNFFINKLEQYKNLATCVLFLGGEWHPEQLVTFLTLAVEHGYKTALYTGLDEIGPNITEKLNYLKTGPWKQELGGLNSRTTNQIFKDVKTNKILNELFLNQP
ncbi:MAG: anaerobic ribonucleoside-triphosphate reductase activating protein [Bdellovibrionia bacterium]